MNNFLDALSRIGAATLEPLWLPLAMWTLLCAPLCLALTLWRSGHPWIKYQAYLALLLALPFGVIAGWVTDFNLLAWLIEPAPNVSSSTPGGYILYLDPALFEMRNSTPGMMHLLGLAAVLGIMTASIQGLHLFARWNALRRLKRTLTPLHDPEIRTIANRIAASVGLNRAVQLFVTDEPLVPMTCGAFRSAIILPLTLLEDRQSLAMALRHEMIHIRRYDEAMQRGEHLLGAVFWLHPLVAFLRRKIEYYREVTCDLEVLAEGSFRPKAYALLLYSFLATPTRSPLSTGMAGTPKQLTRRITAMKTTHQPFSSRTRRTGLLVGSMLLGLTVVAIACTDIIGQDAPDTPPATPSAVVEQTEDEVYVVVEEMPELIGGLASLQQQIRYPEVAKVAGVEGRVIVQFVVDEEGRVVDPVVVRGVDSELDEAALQAVRQVSFKPGRQRGEPVKVKISVPITFKLGETPGDTADASVAKETFITPSGLMQVLAEYEAAQLIPGGALMEAGAILAAQDRC